MSIWASLFAAEIRPQLFGSQGYGRTHIKIHGCIDRPRSAAYLALERIGLNLFINAVHVMVLRADHYPFDAGAVARRAIEIHMHLKPMKGPCHIGEKL